MSLTLAMYTALSSLQTNQAALATISHNIANANTPGYSRQIVEQSSLYTGNVGQGVKIEDIVRKIDKYLMRTIQNQTSDVGMEAVRKDYYDRIQIYFGEPGSQNSLDEFVETFFNSLQTLAETPEVSSLRANAINSGVVLANEISNLAGAMEDLRYQADQDIDESIKLINTKLEEVFNLNIAISNAHVLDASTAGLLDQRDAAIKVLAEQMDLELHYKDDGQVHIYTAQGIGLVDDTRHRLTYTPAPYVGTFIEDGTLRPIEVVAYDSRGKQIGTPVTLVSAGFESSVITALKSGKLKGLLDLRDVEIPNMLAQLDEMAATLRDTFNAIHNDGSGFPPASVLTGERFVTLEDENEWSGSFMMAILDNKGNPLANPFANADQFTPPGIPENGGVRPLKLNLEFSSGGQVGRHSVETIMDELNAFLGPTQAKASVGNLNDIRLVSTSNATGGNFTFDFQLENTSDQKALFRVLNVQVDGGGFAAPSPAPYGDVEVEPGEYMRTGANVVGNPNTAFDVLGLAAGAHTIEVEIEVEDEDGNISPATLTFVVNYDPFNEDVQNDRYVVANANAVSGGTYTAPAYVRTLGKAELVDVDGNPVSAGEGGYLRITAGTDPITGEEMTISFDELDSSENGRLTDSPPVRGTGWGFSHYFGLNNFFTSNEPFAQGDRASGSAINMAVRQDIQKNPNLIALGQLYQTPEDPDPDNNPIYTFQRSIGDNSIIQRLAKLGLESVGFDAAGGLPAITQTFNGYASEFIGFIAAATAGATNAFNNDNLLLQGFVARADAISGVNLDEELGNTLLYQHAYTATAKVITIADQLFESLLNSF